MAKDGIARFTFIHDLFVGVDNVFVCGTCMFVIVQENRNVLILKAVHILHVFNHVSHIVVASRQDALLVTCVVDANQDGAVRAGSRGWDEIKGFVDINRMRSRELVFGEETTIKGQVV
jgi:hypothetical protein